MKEALEAVMKVIEHAEQNNLTNSQEFINFLDTLNEISIRY